MTREAQMTTDDAKQMTVRDKSNKHNNDIINILKNLDI